MLNACIPQPVGHLFADYIGLLCTKKVTRSLLRPSREAASATPPRCPSIAVVFLQLRPVSDPAVSKEIHPKVDALPSSHHVRVLVSSPCWPCYCFVCFLREKVRERVLEPRTSGTKSLQRRFFLCLHSQLLLGQRCINTVRPIQTATGFTSADKGRNSSHGTHRS